MRNTLLAVMALAAILFTQPVRAADEKAASGGTKIAVVDVQTVVGSSKAGKSIQDQINKQRDLFKEEFSKLEKELADAQKKLTEEVAAKPEEAATKKKDFEGRLMQANQLVQEKRQALDKAAAEASLELRKEIVKIAATLAKKDGYDIVLSSQNVIVSQESMDITKKVQDDLDKQLPDMKLKMESAAAEKPAGKKK